MQAASDNGPERVAGGRFTAHINDTNPPKEAVIGPVSSADDALQAKDESVQGRVDDKNEPVIENGDLRNIDHEIVDWQGEDDPECPLNWPMRTKVINVTIVSAWTLLTPLASSMVAPGILGILKEFGSTDTTLGSFVVSIFVLGYAVGPLVIAPMSEIYGRVPVYGVCNALFVVWTLACAFAPNLGALLVFRFFQGVAGVCPQTIGSGTISDLIPAEQRGAFMSAFSLGPLLGPVIGPVAGAFLSEREGWRWVFRVLTIAVSTHIGNRHVH